MPLSGFCPQLLAHRIYVACVTQGCSASLRLFGLMEQEQIGRDHDSAESGDEDTGDDGRYLGDKVGIRHVLLFRPKSQKVLRARTSWPALAC